MMTNNKNNLSYLMPFYKMNGYYKGSFKRSKFKYIKSSLIAIFLGIIISSIFILSSQANPFSYFYWTIKIAINPMFVSQTIIVFALYILAAVSLSIGFKCKIFNIGIAGQMMLSGSLVLILGIKNPKLSQGEIIFLGLLISIFAGMILSAFSALLKVFFNVHEVVTTIMMNWIVFYFLKWLFVSKGVDLGLWDASNGVSANISNPNFTLSIFHNTWLLPMIISIFILISVSFLFYKTRFGFQTVLIGENENTAKYSGVNSKRTIILIMSLQGAIAGILGMIYYMDYTDNQINFFDNSYPLFAFNAFAVSLIAFNNFLGIFFISILWSVLDSGALPASQIPQFHISKQIAPLIYGLIIYFAAIYTLFINFNLTLWIKKNYINLTKYREDFLEQKQKKKTLNDKLKKINLALKKEYKEKIKTLKEDYSQNKIDKKSYWININVLKKEFNNNFNLNSREKNYLKQEYKIKYNENYNDHLNSGILKIKNNFTETNKSNLFKLLNDVNALAYKYKLSLIELNDSNDKKKNKKEFNQQITNLILEYKSQKNLDKKEKINLIKNFKENKERGNI